MNFLVIVSLIVLISTFSVDCSFAFYGRHPSLRTSSRNWRYREPSPPLPIPISYPKATLSKIHSNHGPTQNASKLTTDLLIHFDETFSQCGPFKIDIRELTIRQAQEYFRDGKLTSLDLTSCYLIRISSMDVHLKSVIEINPEALAIAKRADNERLKGINKGPLHGIPILIKDNLGTADYMQTTVGALALQSLKPLRDSDVVKRLRIAGAVILGKTNPSEWAYFRGDNIPSGWSGHGGQTISPYNLNEDPSGSSSGSGVAISANLALVSLGTETDGSIISPSTRGALVGLKPTLGAVSTRGVIPLAFSQDVVGPMTRTVADAAALMGVISDLNLNGCDVDITTCHSKQKFKIGVLRHFWNVSDSFLKHEIPSLNLALEALKTNPQVNIFDPVTSPVQTYDGINDESEMLVLRHEFKYSINNYLKDEVKHLEGRLNRSIHTLSDVIKFNILNPPKEGYNQVTLIAADETDGLLNATYIARRNGNRQETVKYLESTLTSNGVDVLASPCYSDDNPRLYNYGAISGYPSITVPVDVDEEGMPFGLCLLGRPNSESVLLKLAFFVESTRKNKRAVPRFKS